MTEYLCCDTNIWIDLANVGALVLPFKLDCKFLMYELTFCEELLRPTWICEKLEELGIELVSIEISEYELAGDYGVKYKPLSSHDCVALAIAKLRRVPLLTGDGNLIKAASKECVRVIGTIGLIDWVFGEKIISTADYVEYLKRLLSHPSTRLPISELEARISKYS